MNGLARQKLSSKVPLHHNAMLENVTSSATKNSIALAGDRPSTSSADSTNGSLVLNGPIALQSRAMRRTITSTIFTSSTAGFYRADLANPTCVLIGGIV